MPECSKYLFCENYPIPPTATLPYPGQSPPPLGMRGCSSHLVYSVHGHVGSCIRDTQKAGSTKKKKKKE